MSRPDAALLDVLEVFESVSSALDESVDVALIAERALALALRLTGASVAFIRLEDESGNRKQVFSRTTDPAAGPSHDAIEKFVAGLAAPSASVLKAAEQPGRGHADRTPAAFRSLCGRRLQAGGKVLGVIGVTRESDFTVPQRQALAVFALHVAAALEIAGLRLRGQEMVDALVNLRADLDRSEKQRLINDERARSAERVERAHEMAVAVLMAVSAHARTGSDITDFYARLTATIAQLVGAGKVLFWQLNDEGMLSPIPGGYGIDDAFVARLHPTPCRQEMDDLVAGVVFHDHTFRASRSEESAEFSYVLDSLGVNDAISVPWRAGEQRLGLIAAYDSDRREGFSREDGWVLQKAALAAGLVWQLKYAENDLKKTVERLQKVDAARRLLLKNVSTAVDTARKRFAGELHDDALQKLTAAELQLQRLHEPTAPTGEALDQAQGLLAQTEEALRRLLFEVQPPALELSGGFEQSVRDRINVLTSVTDAEPEIELALTDDLPYELKSLVYRQVAEALTNIEKHAGATEVRLSLNLVEGGVHGIVADNGCGFVVSERDHLPGHIGLLAINERALLAGGWAKIESEPGRGTTVEFWMPVSP